MAMLVTLTLLLCIGAAHAGGAAGRRYRERS
jgi:hypothetical protein